ncbi:hypothetical protein Hanom_Chr15g01386061 [Helianthus anomalus]
MAERTFAIESFYGRARVIAQWGDPENKIHEAIEACPVNCILLGSLYKNHFILGNNNKMVFLITRVSW